MCRDADADHILISHETWGYVRDWVECSELITLDIKGFQQQVIAYDVKCLKEEASQQLKSIEDQERNLMLKVDLTRISKDELIEMIRKL